MNALSLLFTRASAELVANWSRIEKCLAIAVMFIVWFVGRVVRVFGEIQATRKTQQLPNGWRRRRRKTRNNSTANDNPITILCVLGSGGHTTELLQLCQQLQLEENASTPKQQQQHYKYKLVYVHADTDTTSAVRVPTTNTNKPPKFYTLPRARHVGQSYTSSIGTTIWATLHSVKLIVWTVQPDVILCNGPGTCLPIVLVVLLLRILFFWPLHSNPPIPIIFSESLCRVRTLSLTGRLVLPWVDAFLVHWPELAERYRDWNVVLSRALINHSNKSHTLTRTPTTKE